MAICKMTEYAHKSFEELRFEDYQKGNNKGTAAAATTAFGAAAPSPAPGFGAAPSPWEGPPTRRRLAGLALSGRHWMGGRHRRLSQRLPLQRHVCLGDGRGNPPCVDGGAALAPAFAERGTNAMVVPLTWMAERRLWAVAFGATPGATPAFGAAAGAASALEQHRLHLDATPGAALLQRPALARPRRRRSSGRRQAPAPAFGAAPTPFGATPAGGAPARRLWCGTNAVWGVPKRRGVRRLHRHLARQLPARPRPSIWRCAVRAATTSLFGAAPAAALPA